MTTPLSAQVLIATTDYSNHLLSLTREATLETPGAKISVMMNDSFPFASVDPWDDLVVFENGVKTMTGYVTHIIASRAPAAIEVQGFDTYKRCLEWFIGDNLYTGGPDAELTTDLTAHSLSYYVGYLCDLCGISYVITDSTGVGSTLLKSDIPLGLRSVSEALITLIQVGQWNMRVDPAGVLQFEHITGPASADYTLSTVTHYEEEYNDTDTRNQVKIWGLEDFDPLTSGSSFVGGGSILYQESRDVDGINHPRPMVFAGPFIDTVAKAQQVATAALDQWARLEHLLSVEMVGNANIRVGQSIQYFHRQLTSGSYFDVVTDLRSTINLGGYKQELTTGRRAYRYPYWPIPTTPPQEWNSGIIYGEAYDCHLFGDSLFACGYVHFNNDPNARRVWRIERRLITDGSLVWGVSVDTCTTFPGFLNPFTTNEARGLHVTIDGVFITGVAVINGLNTSRTQRTECRNLSSGILIWEVVNTGGAFLPNAEGYDVIANSTQVIVIGAPSTDPLFSYNAFFGAYSVTTGAIINTFNANDGAYTILPTYGYYTNSGIQLELYNNGFITGGGWLKYFFGHPANIIGSGWRLTLRNFLGNIVWDTLQVDGGGLLGPTFQVAANVDTRKSYRMKATELAQHNNSGVQDWLNTTSGTVYLYDHIDATTSFIWQASGSLYKRTTVDGSVLSTRTDAGIVLHGVKANGATSRLGVCGSKDGKFYMGYWNMS